MVSIFIIFSNPFLYYKILYAWQINEPNLEKGKQYEAGILLGGMTMFNKNGKGYFNDREDRFMQTLKLYNQGVIKKIIVSGGSGQLLGNEPAEAVFLQQQFLANNVKPSDIFIESKSRSTFENALFSKHILDSLNLTSPYILISSASHLRRARMVFKKGGMTVLPYPSAFETIDKTYSLEDFVWPNLNVMSGWTGLIKEIIG
ncbi:MAG: YdcF family protein, partial [Deinococcales bacterium]|nr:YdcF family protein [Chitinophagaceae bacterium]